MSRLCSSFKSFDIATSRSRTDTGYTVIAFYSRIHKDCHLTGLRSVRKPKFLTAGFKVKSKNKILKIPYLVKIRLMEELSRMRQLSLVTTNILGWKKSSARLPRHPEFEGPMG